MSARAYPLQWPKVWPKTEPAKRERGMERWGAKHMIAAMFSGFRALPERTGESPWEILGLERDATEKQILEAYREKAKAAHPDREGGSEEAFRQVAEAKDIALASLRS